MTVYFLSPPPFTWRCERRTKPPPPPIALWKEFWWSDLTVKSKYKQKIPQFSLDWHTDLWLHCGSHLIIFISNISPFQHSLRAVTACLRGSLSCLKLFISFPLSVFGCQSPGLAFLPGHHENHLIWVDWSLMALFELGLFHWVCFGHRSPCKDANPHPLQSPSAS